MTMRAQSAKPTFHPHPFLLLALLVSTTACPNPTSSSDDAGQASDGGNESDAGQALDGGIENDDAGNTNDLDAGSDGGVTPAECVPGAAGAMEHFALSPGDGLDLDSTALPMADGRVLVVYETYDVDFTTSDLMAVTLSATDLTPSTPTPIDLGNAPFVSAPAFVTSGGDQFLYFITDTNIQVAPALFRAPVDGDSFGERVSLPALSGVAWLLSWPRFVAMPSGDVGVAYHDELGRPTFAKSADGLQFGPKSLLDTESRAMAKVASFDDGTLAFTYQNGVNPMMSYVRRASPREQPTWSEPVPVSALVNIHDTSAVKRRDGGLDLYYISTSNAPGFRLHRRSLSSDGDFGPETQVTFEASGEVSKPKVTRLADCRLLVTYAEITERDGSGQPVRQRLGAVVLTDDAPLP